MPARSGPGSAEEPRGEAEDPESAGVGRGWGAVERPIGGGDRSPAATASQAEKVGIIRALSGFSFTEEQVVALRQEVAQVPGCSFPVGNLHWLDTLYEETATHHEMILDMCDALRRRLVPLTAAQQAALTAAADPIPLELSEPSAHGWWEEQLGNVDFEPVRIPDPTALSTEQLVATRAYARDAESQSLEEVIEGCVESLRRYGFCCVDHVVPREQVAAVRHELSDGAAEKTALLTEAERQREGPNGALKSHHPIIHQPHFQQHLCHPAVVGIAKVMLDAHVRIAQAGTRNVPSDDQVAEGERGGFGPGSNKGPLGREWHT